MTEKEHLRQMLNTAISPHENADQLEAVTDFLLANWITCVVRCKDRKHLSIQDLCCGYYKNRMCGFIQPNDFCSYGERKNDGK